jgi:hypothetical protein
MDVATESKASAPGIPEGDPDSRLRVAGAGRVQEYEQPGQTKNTFTRLGNLLGVLDREEVKDTLKHLVWIGRAVKTN